MRRVATLVARGEPPAEVFAAVAHEVGSVLDADAAMIVRLDPDGAATVVARVGAYPEELAVGNQWRPEPPLSIAVTLRTGRPARLDDLSEAPGAFGDRLRRAGNPVGCCGADHRRGTAVGRDRHRELVAINTRTSTEQRIADFTELLATAIANADSRDQLTASRARIVAAADDARRRIERDLHDGTQQRLVALSLALRLARSTEPPELKTQVGQVADELDEAIDELREIARGIHPAILSEGGLGPALRTLARRAAIPVELDIRTEKRPPDPIEVAAYYVVSEALTNTTKHARASYARVALDQTDGVMQLSIRDDGIGGADPDGRLGSDRAARPGAGARRGDRGRQPPWKRHGDHRRASAAARLTGRPANYPCVGIALRSATLPPLSARRSASPPTRIRPGRRGTGHLPRDLHNCFGR